MDESLQRALEQTASYYDARKVGDVGALGFRRSTPLAQLLKNLPGLIENRLLVPGVTRFLDMGCADGRVNVFLSFLVQLSVGVEVDEWTLDEYEPLKQGLEEELTAKGLALPPENIHLFHGDTLERATGERILEKTGHGLDSFHIYYTYITMYNEFAELLRDHARPGSIFMIYGFDVILPKLQDFLFLERVSSVKSKLAIYRKV
jgi:hypothetical protein